MTAPLAHRIRIPTAASCASDPIVPHVHVDRDHVLVDLKAFASNYRRRFHVDVNLP